VTGKLQNRRPTSSAIRSEGLCLADNSKRGDSRLEVWELRGVRWLLGNADPDCEEDNLEVREEIQRIVDTDRYPRTK
jgi:hypothetical protein